MKNEKEKGEGWRIRLRIHLHVGGNRTDLMMAPLTFQTMFTLYLLVPKTLVTRNLSPEFNWSLAGLARALEHGVPADPPRGQTMPRVSVRSASPVPQTPPLAAPTVSFVNEIR